MVRSQSGSGLGNRVHVVPFHSHVLLPAWHTMTRRTGSPAMNTGPPPVATVVHAEPFHRDVITTSRLLPVVPWSASTFRDAGSKATCHGQMPPEGSGP